MRPNLNGSRSTILDRITSYSPLLLPLGLLLLILAKVLNHPSASWVGYLPPRPTVSVWVQWWQWRDVATLLAAVAAPFPLALSICLARLRRHPQDLSDTLLTLLGCIVGLQGLLFLGLSAFGALSRTAFLVAQLAVFLIGVVAWVRHHASGHAGRIMRVYAILIGVCLAMGALSVRFGQTNDFDLANYHFYNAHAFVHDRTHLDFAVGDICTYHNPLADLPLYWLIQHTRLIWVGFILGMVHAVPLVLLFALAVRVLGLLDWDGIPRVALALLWSLAGGYGPVSVAELGTGFNDNALTAFVLVSFLLLIQAYQMRREGNSARLPLIFAGLVLGLGIGLKLTLAPFGVAAGLALALVGGSWRQRLEFVGWFGTAALLGLTCSYGPWALHLVRMYGNPIFPYFNGFFGSPYWPTMDASPVALPGWKWSEIITFPFRVLQRQNQAMEVPCRDARLALMVLVLAVAGLTKLVTWFRRRPGEENRPVPVTALLVVFSVTGYLVWLALFRVLRYAHPVQMLAPLLIGVLLVSILRHQRRFVLIAACAVCITMAAWMKVGDYCRWTWSERLYDLQIPPLTDTSNALVLMAWQYNDDPNVVAPLGFVVPYLPSDMRFVKIDGRLMDRRLRMHAEAREVVKLHTGPTYLLAHRAAVNALRGRLAEFGLELRDEAGQSLRASHLDIVFWRAERRSLARAEVE